MKRQEIEDKSLGKRDERVFVQELIHSRKILGRLMKAKWELANLQDEVNTAFMADKIIDQRCAGSMIMHQLNSLMRLPELADAMEELADELIEASIFEEIVSETSGSWPVYIDDHVFGEEVDRVLEEILRDRLMATMTAPGSVVANSPQYEEEQEEFEQDAEMMMARGWMRNRLEHETFEAFCLHSCIFSAARWTTTQATPSATF
ncbi:Snf7, partial [Metarhizium brunneum ARSEF 3297]